jgi:tetratricopeptide (TPR) repeat protein
MGGTSSKAASRTPASGHPNRQAAAAAGGQQQQRPKQQQQVPRQQQQHQQQHMQPPQQQHQEQQVLAGLEAEDPAPFVSELTAREQQYGPNHPAVAESCSNLAILYNQKGNYNSALPLYERALAIYEANYGPNHQEVAHTLTDLAVLHLEQVGGVLEGVVGWGEGSGILLSCKGIACRICCGRVCARCVVVQSGVHAALQERVLGSAIGIPQRGLSCGVSQD